MSAIANQAKSTFYRGQTGPQGPRGPQGEKGDRGDRGDRGANGAQGIGILDATVDANGLLIVTLEDATTIISNNNLTGPQGLQGIQGVSVTSAYIDNNGNLFVALSSGQQDLAGNVSSITSATVNSAGDLVLTKQDNTTINAGNTIGPRGYGATVTVGLVQTGAPGSSAAVVNVGDSADAILNFTIPQGEQGTITSVNNISGAAITLTTEDIAEGTNKYYTDERSRAALSVEGDLNYNPITGVFSYTAPVLNYDSITGLPTLAAVSTTGSYTDLVNKPTTTEIQEGSNLYFTNARAQNAVTTITGNAGTATKLNTTRTISGVGFDGSADITLTTSNIPEGTNKYYTDAKVDTRIALNDTTKSTSLAQFGAVKLGSHLSVTGAAGVIAWHVGDSRPVYHDGTAWYYMDGLAV